MAASRRSATKIRRFTACSLRRTRCGAPNILGTDRSSVIKVQLCAKIRFFRGHQTPSWRRGIESANNAALREIPRVSAPSFFGHNEARGLWW